MPYAVPKLHHLLHTAAAQLKSANVENGELDAAIMLALACNSSRDQLVLHPEQIILDKASILRFQELLTRRLNREPLSHITGQREFWSREFIVTPAVLTPRPDSETLIATVLEHAPISSTKKRTCNILDLGTGSGCLLITLLCEYQDAHGVGIDYSADALQVAKENALRHGVSSRITLLQSDWLQNLPTDFRFDIVVANPPYIPLSDLANLQPEVRRYEPIMALTDNGDGLSCYHHIAAHIKSFLHPNAYIFLEIGINQANQVCHILEQHHFKVIAIRNDLAGVPRCIVAS